MSIVEFNCYLTSFEYNNIKLNYPLLLFNTIYYIQSVNKFNALDDELCTITLLKI